MVLRHTVFHQFRSHSSVGLSLYEYDTYQLWRVQVWWTAILFIHPHLTFLKMESTCKIQQEEEEILAKEKESLLFLLAILLAQTAFLLPLNIFKWELFKLWILEEFFTFLFKIVMLSCLFVPFVPYLLGLWVSHFPPPRISCTGCLSQYFQVITFHISKTQILLNNFKCLKIEWRCQNIIFREGPFQESLFVCKKKWKTYKAKSGCFIKPAFQALSALPLHQWTRWLEWTENQSQLE